jgi:SnoaL-like polyketide cyclase
VDVEQNEGALIRAVEAWNSGDVGSYLELYGEGIKLHAGTYDFPDKKSVEDELAARYAVTGTDTGELMGIPATGREISITGIIIMHFEEAKVVERWDIDDSAEALSRLRGD